MVDNGEIFIAIGAEHYVLGDNLVICCLDCDLICLHVDLGNRCVFEDLKTVWVMFKHVDD